MSAFEEREDERAVFRAAETMLCKEKTLLLAIDGRCAAGKTTLAEKLKQRFGCGVLHMDDFFLRPFQRTPARLAEPGGNVDYERFLNEVLCPLSQGREAVFRPWLCHTQRFGDPVRISAGPLVVTEGSYSCHPALRKYYGLRVFLSVSPQEQLRRIEKRNGPEATVVFREKWIPLEELYFSRCGVEEACELRLSNEG